MRRRRFRPAAALAVLAMVAPAAALAAGDGSFSVFIFGTSGGPGGHAVESRIDVSGSITVDFHGDEAAGCAEPHLCEVVGQVRWDPSGTGSLTAIGYRQRGKRFEQGFMSYADAFGEDRLQTSARVRRSGVPGSLCADGDAQNSVDSNSSPRRGSLLEVRLLDLPSAGLAPPEVLRTRCAGPTTGDIAALLPARRISERQLLRGPRTLDFSADKSFASHGLAGTLHSNVVVRIDRGAKVPLNSGFGRLPPGTRKVRKRILAADFRVERASGQVVTSVRGRGDPDLCGPLDACGLLGSVTTTPTATSGAGTISAIGSIHRSRSDLRRALGLTGGPRPRGVLRSGDAGWDRDSGGVASQLTRDDAPACSDSLPISGGGGIILAFSGGRVTASYGSEQFGVTDLVKTRCPGPGESDAPAELATGSYPLSIFRHRRVTLRLTRGAGYSSGGYSGRTRADITVVLRRTRIRSSTFTDIEPSDGSVRSLR
jgi:hypothetical protein